MWDPSAVIAFACALGAILLREILSTLPMRSGRVSTGTLKLVIALSALLLIVGLKIYA